MTYISLQGTETGGCWSTTNLSANRYHKLIHVWYQSYHLSSQNSVSFPKFAEIRQMNFSDRVINYDSTRLFSAASFGNRNSPAHSKATKIEELEIWSDSFLPLYQSTFFFLSICLLKKIWYFIKNSILMLSKHSVECP